jgi:glycerophosphoryl diester phosphodiesterase
MIDPSRLVAHRGEMRHYPENSLPALRAAIEAGARHVEFDVQFSSDGVPVVLHDPDLLRVAGVPREIAELSTFALSTITLGAGPTAMPVAPISVPLLRDVVDLLNRYPGVHAFVELKRHGVERLGIDACLRRLGDELSGASFAWTLISFRDDVISAAAPQLRVSTGWVLREFSEASRRTADSLGPDYLFCDLAAVDLEKERLWEGPWKWVLYDVAEVSAASDLLDRGVDMIETGNILAFLYSGG